MLDKRLELHEKLCATLGSRYVYFQPPPSVKMNYPCIVYSENRHSVNYANNGKYKNKTLYLVKIIDKNPDSNIPNKIEKYQFSSYDRSYVADNLNHWVYNLYY